MKIKKCEILRTSTRSVQNFGHFFAIFCLDFLFCKHAKFSKVNSKFSKGIDFFQPSNAFFDKNERKYLFPSYLEKNLKIRLFSAKKFLAQNFQNMKGVECSFSEQELTKIQKQRIC